MSADAGAPERTYNIGTANWQGNAMKTQIIRFSSDESGATAIEYGLIASLIAIAIIAAMTNLGSSLSNTFNNISGNLK